MRRGRLLAISGTLVAVALGMCLLMGCMRVQIEAREGSTVNVDQRKTVTTTTDASIPAGALGL
jgi:hypothetical protein